MNRNMFRHPRLWLCLAMSWLLCPVGCQGPVDAETENPVEVLSPEMRAAWYDAAAGHPPVPPKDLTSEMLDIPPSPVENSKPDAPFPIYKPGKESGTEFINKEPPVTFSGAEKVKVDFNFQNAAFVDVAPVFAGLLNFNYVIEGTIPGTVTMSVHEEMTQRETWEMFKQLLALSGAVATYEDKVVHLRSAGAGSNNLSLDSLSSEIELGTFRLKNITVKNITQQINTFLPRGVKAVELEAQNTLLVLDNSATLSRISELLTQLDQPNRSDWYKVILPCHNVSAERLAIELGEVLPVLGFPVAVNSTAPPAGAIQLTSLERLQVIVAASANQEALEELSRWMGVLDQADIGDQERVFIYNILNGQADELVKALAVMFPVSGGLITTDKSGSVKAEDNITSSSNQPGSLGKGPASVFDVPVKVFSDAVQNRLVIRTKPRTYAMLKALLERLDTIPNQVLLQVLVIEVTLTDAVQFGVEFMTQTSIDGMESSAGTDYKYLQPGGKEQYGAKYWLFDPDNPSEKFGYVNALAGRTNVKVISRPQVLVISHNPATISVGDRVPIITAEVTNTSSSSPDGTTLVRSVKYEDTGIILKITPHVTRGGRIGIDIDQTVSEAQANKTSNIDSPTIQERILKTVMSLRDGQTVICGGLIREKATDNLDSVPIVSSIPFLRRLLGSTDVSTVRTEMLILVTGYIVSEDTKLEDLLKGYEQSVDSLIEFAHNTQERRTRQFKHSGNLDSWFFE